MRKLLLVSVFCLSALLTACDGGSSDDRPTASTNTVGRGSNSVEAELRNTLARSGLDAENIVFYEPGQSLTFKIGTCEGGISTFSMKIFRGPNDQAEILSVPLTAEDMSILDAAQQDVLIQECGL